LFTQESPRNSLRRPGSSTRELAGLVRARLLVWLAAGAAPGTCRCRSDSRCSATLRSGRWRWC